MNLILFIFTLVVSFIAVRVGAVAFQLTGLEWSLAKFQALSCFSGTGFTTREAELITGHPRRRQIASVLMVLGNAGLVTLIATFANSIRPRVVATPSWASLWGFRPLVNLLIIAAAIYWIFRFFVQSSAARRITEYMRSKLQAARIVEPVSVEELMVASGGYGVLRAEVREASPFAERTLATSGLRDLGVTVLVVRRGDEVMPNPSGETRIQHGDHLLCFGELDKMRRVFTPEERE